jgi:hypothetical protein
MLFHLSEEGDIRRFEPRASAYAAEPVVWAVDEARVRNYLLPRDCPRVTFYAGAATSRADVQRFLGSSPTVVALESAWLDRVRGTRLFRYRFGDEGFVCIDRNAGYYVSRETVVPRGVEVIEDLLGALRDQGVEIRILPSLWGLHDAVMGSSLQYSIIRMRNARARVSE